VTTDNLQHQVNRTMGLQIARANERLGCCESPLSAALAEK